MRGVKSLVQSFTAILDLSCLTFACLLHSTITCFFTNVTFALKRKKRKKKKRRRRDRPKERRRSRRKRRRWKSRQRKHCS